MCGRERECEHCALFAVAYINSQPFFVWMATFCKRFACFECFIQCAARQSKRVDTNIYTFMYIYTYFIDGASDCNVLMWLMYAPHNAEPDTFYWFTLLAQIQSNARPSGWCIYYSTICTLCSAMYAYATNLSQTVSTLILVGFSFFCFCITFTRMSNWAAIFSVIHWW